MNGAVPGQHDPCSGGVNKESPFYEQVCGQSEDQSSQSDSSPEIQGLSLADKVILILVSSMVFILIVLILMLLINDCKKDQLNMEEMLKMEEDLDGSIREVTTMRDHLD